MKRDWWNKEFRIMFTLGESTTAGGWSSCRERRWANLLAQMINEVQRMPVQLVNVGIGANVISTKSPAYSFSGKPAADERLDKHVLNWTANGCPLLPDLLIIAYGQNDGAGGTPVEFFCHEMTDIVRRVRAKIRPLIVLAGPYHVVDFSVGLPEFGHGSLATLKQYNEATRQLAAELDCLFVDLQAAYGGADWLVHHDGVHANDLGHRVVANRIFEVLASNCSGLALETKELEKCIVPWRDEAVLQQ
jgi:lysophospholipase L1-like esterase